MHIAIVGCGFVADYYMATLSLHPGLHVAGAFDRDARALARFTAAHTTRAYSSLAQLLADDQVEIVLNLTNPRSHAEVSRAALEAGKHVYSEKPFATELAEAKRLVETAEEHHLLLSSAPCSLLGETAQTIWRALRDQLIGPVRL